MGNYSVHKTNPDTGENVCLYDFIEDINDADLLAQLAMCNKRTEELIIIMPGWNRGIKDRPEEYKKALKLAEEYKAEKECQRCKRIMRSYKLRELQLDGTEDIYTLELCNKCYDYLSSDYFSPEDVDQMFK
jgi:hypothetical protein